MPRAPAAGTVGRAANKMRSGDPRLVRSWLLMETADTADAADTDTPRAVTPGEGARKFSARDAGLNLGRGFLMGAADIVPGVSGGTIALIVGIYERLINAIRLAARGLGDVCTLKFKKAADRFKEVDWLLVIPVVFGILIAILTIARLIVYLLDEYPIGTEAAFFGLVLGSLIVPWRRIESHDWRHILLGLAAACAAFFIVGVREIHHDEIPVFAYFIGGAVAICAMILPGVSGAYLLEIMGLYRGLLDAVNNRDIGVLAVFFLGAVVGLSLFSQLLHWLLRRYHDWTMAVLTGLMLGSLRALWPWSEEGSNLQAPPANSETAIAFVIMALAFAAITILIVVGNRSDKTDETADAQAVSR